jgi:hypothetical protein
MAWASGSAGATASAIAGTSPAAASDDDDDGDGPGDEPTEDREPALPDGEDRQRVTDEAVEPGDDVADAGAEEPEQQGREPGALRELRVAAGGRVARRGPAQGQVGAERDEHAVEAHVERAQLEPADRRGGDGGEDEGEGHGSSGCVGWTVTATLSGAHGAARGPDVR